MLAHLYARVHTNPKVATLCAALWLTFTLPLTRGLPAASLGLPRMYSDDLEQLDTAMPLYDAFYRWAQKASDETHNRPPNKPKAQ